MTAAQQSRPRSRVHGLTTLAAALLAVSAFFAAGLAPAAGAASTALCKANEYPCSAANTYVSGITLKAVATDFKIEHNAVTFNCDEATVELKTKASVGDPLNSELTSLSFDNCDVGGAGGAGDCLVEDPGETVLTNPAINQNGKDSATAYPFGAAWTWTCDLGQGFSELEANVDATGMTAGFSGEKFVFHETPIECTGLCDGETYLTAHFAIVSPESVYVEKGTSAGTAGTRLCKVAQDYCVASNVYPSGTTIEASANPITISTSRGDIECPGSLKAKSSAASGNPLHFSITSWGISGSGCAVSGEFAECEVAVTSGATVGGLSWGSGTDGVFAVAGTELNFWLVCGGTDYSTTECQYELWTPPDNGLVDWSLEGGNPAQLDAYAHLNEMGYTDNCPEIGGSTIEADYTVTAPKPLYVTR